MPPPGRGYNNRRYHQDGARMRMDSYRGSNHYHRGGGGGGYRRNNMRHHRSSVSPRRRELGHMMQHARRDNQSAYWTKRLLEAEEKDPNRWRHSGFKEMYRDELKDNSGSRDDSASSASSRSRSRSPMSRPRTPQAHRSSPKSSQRRPRPRSPPSPPSKHGGSRDKSRGRPRTPSHKRSSSRQHSRRSESYSSSDSMSSCTDDSCSECSPKHSGKRTPPTPPTPPPKKKMAIAKKPIKKTEVKKAPKPRKVSPVRKKKSDARRPKTPPAPRTPESSSSTSSSSSESESSSEDTLEQPRVSLSERFGKMAQWSVDRKEYDQIKMRITKDAGTSGMKVVIENDADFPNLNHHHPGIERPIVRSVTPEKDYAFHYEKRRCFFERSFTRERPIGPDVPMDWLDPIARYSYYRSKGLLWEPDVTFDEYLKWEEWWARYQDWLDSEKMCYGENVALDNARRQREKDWESYRNSNMGRSIFQRELLPLPRNQPWNRLPNMIRGRGGIITRRKFLQT